MTNTNTAADSVTAIIFEHEDGRYAINPNTTGDPAWHRLGPVDVSAIAATPAQQALPEVRAALALTGCTAGTDEECTRRGCAASCPALTTPQPATSHPAVKSDMTVNGGALKLALNVLRRAGKTEVADELEITAQPATWPTNAAEVREFMASNCERTEYANAPVTDDVAEYNACAPSDNDRYQLTAHDFLSAVDWWTDRDATAPAAQALDSVRVFWQQHTQADALSMTMAELHDDVELVIRTARGATQAAPRNAALATPAQAVPAPGVPSDSASAVREACGKIIKTLAAIVNSPQSDDQLDNEVLQRDPVMAKVMEIKSQVDVIYKAVPLPTHPYMQRQTEDLSVAYFMGLHAAKRAPQPAAQAQEDAKDAAIEARQGGAAWNS